MWKGFWSQTFLGHSPPVLSFLSSSPVTLDLPLPLSQAQFPLHPLRWGASPPFTGSALSSAGHMSTVLCCTVGEEGQLAHVSQCPPGPDADVGDVGQQLLSGSNSESCGEAHAQEQASEGLGLQTSSWEL